jgi:predicted extracellular nuclease
MQIISRGAARTRCLRLAAALLVLGSSAAQAQVVISQVFGGGGNAGSPYNRDYVELFNRGLATASLTSWSIQYAAATGATNFSSNVTILSGSVAPGHYVLVGIGPTSGTGAPLSVDISGNPSINLSASNGKVVLVSTATGLTCNGNPNVCSPSQLATIVDLVGYGTANFFDGASAAPAGSNTTALFRAGSGCIDTNQNGADFTSGVPAPRNSASAANVCPSGTSVNLSVDANVGSEAATSVITATATASAPVVGDQTVTLSVTGAGVTAGDYSLSSTTITIPSNGTTGSATFTVVDDVLTEGTEVATLSISNPSAGIVLGSVTSQNIAITDNDGCGLAATRIHAVQGSGDSTPLLGAWVAIEGIVVGRFQGTPQDSLQGFFVQEEDADADGDPTTSEGIFVYEGNGGLAAGIALGDRVRVTGTADEFFGSTELNDLSGVEICSHGEPMPTAASLTLPVLGVPNGDLGAATAAIDAYYESFEGMRVTFPATLTVSEYSELERYGQLVLSQGGRIPSFTDAHAPSVSGFVDHQIDVARRTIILDDGDNHPNSALDNAHALPYPEPGLSLTNRFRGGDTITGLTGVLDWSFAGVSGTDAWRIRPVAELESYVFTPSNPRPAGPPDVSGRLRIASFNVLNYFQTLDTGALVCGPSANLECRGANSASERTRQTDKLVSALCQMNADVVALMEIENDTSAAASAIVAAANAVPGCGAYSFVSTGAIGTDAIKVALLYAPANVTPVGGDAILDSTVDPRFVDTRNRPVLAQTFVENATGANFTVAAAHLKSKGSACDDLGDVDAADGQGNCNGTRTLAAQALVDWLATDPTASNDRDFLIIGDLNSYAKEDPVRAILAGPDDTAGTSDDYTDLIASYVGPPAYSYLFDGQIGRLDHALASPSLASQVTGAGEWHIDADEPPSFDYNDTVVDPGEASFEAKPSALPLYAADPWRTSDHDPLVVGLPEPGFGALIGSGAIALALLSRRRARIAASKR